MSRFVPRHFSENFGHGTDVGEAREYQAQSDERGKEQPAGIKKKCECGGSEHKQPCAESDLAFERPAGPDALDNGEAGLNPGARAAFQNGEMKLAWLEKAGGHSGALAHLADEDDWRGRTEVGEAGLDLVQGNVNGAGDVAGSEFGGRADVDELCLARRLGVESGNCDGWRQNYLTT
jgi:hypothetical protein